MGLEFIAALYNEENELPDLIAHVESYVDRMHFVDDGSTDQTLQILEHYKMVYRDRLNYKVIPHTGLPETVKHEALGLVSDGSWVLMLDADERFAPGVLAKIQDWVNDGMNVHGISDEISHVYFHQYEVIDQIIVREFQKSKLFKKEAIQFPLNNIHADDQFIGDGLFQSEWAVYHRKSTSKQVQRETEYLATYRKLKLDGHIDEGRERWLQGLHHYVRPKG